MRFITAIFILFALATARPATAFESSEDFARSGMGIRAVELVAAAHSRAARVGAPTQLSGAIPDMIATAAAQTVGSRWTPTLFRIAKIESGMRCAPGGNGGGLFQFTHGTRRLLGLGNPNSCSANISAAMRYASRCIAMGARSGAQLGACWNSGNPFTARRHLERAYRVAGL